MQQITKAVFQIYSNLSKSYKIMLGTLIAVTSAVAIWQPIIKYSDDKKANSLQEMPIKLRSMLLKNKKYIISNFAKFTNSGTGHGIVNNNDQLTKTDMVSPTKINISDKYIILSGDNLSSILTQYGLNMKYIIALSNQYHDLYNLQIGQALSWKLNENEELKILTWTVSQHETRTYTRQGNSIVFNEDRQIHQGVWIDKVIQGTINSNFTSSVVNAGLTYHEAYAVYKALRWQIDLRKLKFGDRFSILLSREMLNGHNEQSCLLAVHLLTNGKNYYAFRAENGRYYDSEANILERRFLRYPTTKTFKISSPFSLRRINPVTGYLSIHQGIDLSMPIGTPILAVGDGEVIVAKYGRAAGNFITVRHGRHYITRYMHLYKLLVKAGQKIKRGECIALSGNTGRTTGPHLHYELWCNQHAINPVTANIPYAYKLTGKDRQLFLSSIKDSKLRLANN